MAGERGIALTTVYTTGQGQAEILAREHAGLVDLLVAVGGDGTVSDVITGAWGSAVPVGIVPTGSSNMVAKELNIPRDLRRASAVALANSAPMEVDVARAGDTTVIHMAGAGFDAEIMRLADRRWKHRVGWPAYLGPAIRSLRYPAFKATIGVDGQCRTVRARLVLCALGGSVITPRFQVGEGIDRTDGLIDVCVWDPPTLLATVSCLSWIALKRPGRSRWLRQTRGKRVELSADRDVPFEVDGDWVGSLPVTIEMIDWRARLQVPQQQAPAQRRTIRTGSSNRSANDSPSRR